MALAIHFDAILARGEFETQADLARAGQITRARLTQILNLTNLAPDIQERLLFLSRYESGRAPIIEREIRRIASEPNWEKQRKAFRRLLPAGDGESVGSVPRRKSRQARL